MTYLCFFRVSTLCKRSKRLSWTRSINSNQMSTKEKKKVHNRKLTLEIYSRFDIARFSFRFLLFAFFLVHFFVCLFVRFFLFFFVCWLIYLFKFRILVIPSPRSGSKMKFKKHCACFTRSFPALVGQAGDEEDAERIRKLYTSFVISFFRNLTKRPRNLFNLKQLWRCKPRYFVYCFFAFVSRE